MLTERKANDILAKRLRAEHRKSAQKKGEKGKN